MYSTDDPVGELRDLQERYARMADEELEALANEAYQLTGIAHDALRSEIRNRKLNFTLREAPEPVSDMAPEREGFDPANLDLVEAQRIWSKDEARTFMEVLVQAGVSCYLGPHNVETVDEFDGDFERGVQLKVPSLDWQRAGIALQDLRPDEEDAVTPIEYRCPKCKSDEIVFEELEKESEDQPDFQAKEHWHCDACGHQWINDNPIEEGQRG